MTGLSVRLYWVSNFIFDFTIYFCYFVAMFTLILIWDRAFDYGLYFANPLSTRKFQCILNVQLINFVCFSGFLFAVPFIWFGSDSVCLRGITHIQKAIDSLWNIVSTLGDHWHRHGSDCNLL